MLFKSLIGVLFSTCSLQGSILSQIYNSIALWPIGGTKAEEKQRTISATVIVTAVYEEHFYQMCYSCTQLCSVLNVFFEMVDTVAVCFSYMCLETKGSFTFCLYCSCNVFQIVKWCKFTVVFFLIIKSEIKVK